MSSAFRVRPYLHAPHSHGMTIIWFSHDRQPGELRFAPAMDPGSGERGPVRSEPEAIEHLAYTAAELTEEIPPLATRSWLHPGGNVRHVVVLSGLRPQTRYTYTVTQQGEVAEGSFTTAPSAQTWQRIRIAALADSEVAPAGRANRRSWGPGPGAGGRPGAEGPWRDAFGVNVRDGQQVLRYPLTEGAGYRAVIDMITADEPDLIMHPGDLVQGGGYQPGWDEFFRINAGAEGQVLSHTPLLPALGNWENFGAINGQYGTAQDRSAVVRSRAKYHAYFPGPGPGKAAGEREGPRGYYRTDYGPLTILTLDSSNGEPDEQRPPASRRRTGRDYGGPGTDTQHYFTAAQYRAAGGADLSDIAPGSAQWNWTEQNLRQARRQGRIILVQFHHIPYSSGAHGLPMDHELSTGQGGTPMRRYQPMFREYGVTAVICGHSELFERSVVTGDGTAHPDQAAAPPGQAAGRTAPAPGDAASDQGGADGPGVLYYDVGVAGDSLGGELRHGPGQELLRYNPYRAWTADQDAFEQWVASAGDVPVLRAGGKHYGYLDLLLEPTGNGARMRLRPVHAFPVLTADLGADAEGGARYEVGGIERRTYDDEVLVDIGPDGRPRAHR